MRLAKSSNQINHVKIELNKYFSFPHKDLCQANSNRVKVNSMKCIFYLISAAILPSVAIRRSL